MTSPSIFQTTDPVAALTSDFDQLKYMTHDNPDPTTQPRTDGGLLCIDWAADEIDSETLESELRLMADLVEGAPDERTYEASVAVEVPADD